MHILSNQKVIAKKIEVMMYKIGRPDEYERQQNIVTNIIAYLYPISIWSPVYILFKSSWRTYLLLGTS